jgi:adenosylcobinamide-phosphate synthase
MAAMAGALGVRLEKRGHYRLGEGPAPGADAGWRALRIAAGAAILTGLAAVAQASLR